MKRVPGIALVVATLIASGAVPSHAVPAPVPGRAPSLMSGRTIYVFPGVTYTIGCLDYGAMFLDTPAAMTMFAYTLNDMKGKKIASYVAVRDNFNSEFVAVSAGGQYVTQTKTLKENDFPEEDFTFYRITSKKLGVLRIGYAVWGGGAYCFLAFGRSSFGSSGISLAPMPTYRARFAYPSDFSGGVAGDAGLAPAPVVGSTTGQGGSVSVAALQKFTRNAKGYAFALFRPGTGVAKVEDPKKKVRYDSVAKTGTTTFMEATKGTWTYSLDVNLAQSRSPALWLMELP